MTDSQSFVIIKTGIKVEEEEKRIEVEVAGRRGSSGFLADHDSDIPTPELPSRSNRENSVYVLYVYENGERKKNG